MQLRDQELPESGARTLHGIQAFDPASWTLPGMVSSDGHVDEPPELWDELPARLRANLPDMKLGGDFPAGARDPYLRVKDQDIDGVCAEIIFPNSGMILFGLDDVDTQREGMRLYNDWMAAYCKTSPKRLFGVPTIPVYDIDAAIAEMYRAHDLGMVGIMVWQVADPTLPFHSGHYEKLWAAAAEARVPVHCHILTGHSYTKNASWAQRNVFEKIKNSVNTKQADTVNTLYDFVFSGVFDRHPDLKLVLAESEVGWLPYVAQQWDYYYERNALKVKEMPMKRLPSEIIKEHVYCTFLEDFAGTRHFNWWGQDNCMWSNDYPHFNMTFPNSRANVIRHIGNLPHDIQVKLVRDNAVKLYHLDI